MNLPAGGLNRARAAWFGAVVSLTDLLPPRVRYGYVHRATARILRGPAPTLGPLPTTQQGDPAPGVEVVPAPSATHRDQTAYALATGDLEIGGIGSVIEVLARGLVQRGIPTVVICLGDGPRARRLRAEKVDVRYAGDLDEARAALADVSVVALHSAAEHVERAALDSDLPLVVAMHNTEIHFTRKRWGQFRTMVERSSVGVAVSETVREFHARHVGDELAARFVVVPNGSPLPPPTDPEHRAAARAALAAASGTELAETDIVFACLARYDSQKNVAGTVASFLHAIETAPLDAHFVYAGEPSDWAEFRRADSIRRCSPYADRVHLLANSDAATVLAAADAFLLNSFFEGWPMAATEAAAAGLPLILSDVGGAAELVASASGRSVLIPNASGDGAAVSDARVRAARRRSHHQTNRNELADALRVVAERARAERGRPLPPAVADGVSAMVAGHLAALESAVGARLAKSAGRPQ